MQIMPAAENIGLGLHARKNPFPMLTTAGAFVGSRVPSTREEFDCVLAHRPRARTPVEAERPFGSHGLTRVGHAGRRECATSGDLILRRFRHCWRIRQAATAMSRA